MDEQGDQLGISKKLVTDDETIPDTYSLMSDRTCSINSVFFYFFDLLVVNTLLVFAFPFATFDVSPDQCGFLEVFAENIVGIEILRELQDSIW